MVQEAGGFDCESLVKVAMVLPLESVQEPTPAVAVPGHTQ